MKNFNECLCTEESRVDHIKNHFLSSYELNLEDIFPLKEKMIRENGTGPNCLK